MKKLITVVLILISLFSVFAVDKYRAYDMVADTTGISFKMDTDYTYVSYGYNYEVVRFDIQFRANTSDTDGSNVIGSNYGTGAFGCTPPYNNYVALTSYDTSSNIKKWQFTIPYSAIGGIDNFSSENFQVWIGFRPCYGGNALDSAGHTTANSSSYVGAYASFDDFKLAKKILYVSSTGNDTTGNGTVSNPYATITKAYDSLLENGGTIALLSDLTLSTASTTLTIEENKNVTITSAKKNGELVSNAAGDYSGVHTIHRGSFKYDFISMNNTSNLTLKQIILDGDQKTVSTYLISATSTIGDVEIVLDTNSILRNNISTGNNGSNCGSGIVFGSENSLNNPKMYMKSNAKITGCIAPRHGGALTIYDGDVYMQDNSLMEYNGVDYKPTYSAFYGGGAILCYRGNLHMTDNSKITKNFVQLNGGYDSGRQHNSMQADPNTQSKVYISGNAKIFDNYDDGFLSFNNDGSYTLSGDIQANSYANGEAFFIDGAVGSKAKIGVTISGATNGMTVVQATGSYSLTDADANAFFEDSGTYKFYRDGNVIKLSTQLENVVLKLTSLNSTKLLGYFSLDFAPSVNDFSIYKNGVKMDSGYTITVNGKNLSVTFDTELALNTKIGVSVSKNGYRVNEGKITERNYGHNHDWKFTAIGSVIKAVCLSQDSYVADCNFNGEENAMYFGITAGGNIKSGVDIIPSNATNKNMVWTSSNPDVLKVDENGLVRGKTKGTATITAVTADGSNRTSSYTVKVVE